jgi:hypothetical protein
VIWIHREFAGAAALETFKDPDRLLAEKNCAIIKDQRKVKVGALEVALAGKRLRVYIKRYNVSWRHRIGSLFALSGALRALRGAAILREAGIATARPIAAVERRRCGMVASSFYLSEEIAEGKVSTRYWCDDLASLAGAPGRARRRIFVHTLAELFKRLHEKNIYHNDLKDFNILVESTDDRASRLYLLDLEGVRRLNRISRRRRVKNLVQLNRSLGKFFSRTDSLRFLKLYLGSAQPGRELKRWAGDIVSQSAALDRAKRIANS